MQTVELDDEVKEKITPLPFVDDRVNPLWKWVALLSVGIILGGLPAYAALLVNQREALTRKDVDDEIVNLQAPLTTQVSDLKDQVHDLVGEIHELSKIRTP